MVVTTIVSGGQTGADRGALQAASLLNIKTTGYMPNGLLCDDCAGATIKEMYGLSESSGGYRMKDVENCALADGLLAFFVSKKESGAGTTKTVQYFTTGNYDYSPIIWQPCEVVRELVGDKPCLLILDAHLVANQQIICNSLVAFLHKFKPQTLMVSGPLEGTMPGITAAVSDILQKCIAIED